MRVSAFHSVFLALYGSFLNWAAVFSATAAGGTFSTSPRVVRIPRGTRVLKIRAVINDPTVEVRWARERYRPAGASRLNTELFAALEAETKKHYGVEVLPTMSTGASDKAQIRSKGVQCYGIGPAIESGCL